jgi:hypothetical protein
MLIKLEILNNIDHISNHNNFLFYNSIHNFDNFNIKYSLKMKYYSFLVSQ